MPYKALTYVQLGDVKKNPGDSITKAEFDAANQTKEDIDALVKGGAISENADAEIDASHAPVEVSSPPNTTHILVTDGGSGGDSN